MTSLNGTMPAIVAKRTFHTLDGLRGVAAISVVLAHFGIFAVGLPMPSAYLAVDLFFLMSGVVVCHVYQDRLLCGLSITRFIAIRVARLYPMYFLGLIVSVLALSLSRWAHQPLSFGWSKALLAKDFALNLLMLPSPSVATHPRLLFTLNFVSWSLFWEMVINIAFAACIRVLSDRVLTVIVAVSGCALIALAMSEGGLDAGVQWDTFHGGPIRVVFSFTLGVLLYRRHASDKGLHATIPALALLLLTGALISMRPIGIGRVIFDVFCVMLAFPAIVAASLDNEPLRGQRIYSMLGVISYPLYVLHIPVLTIVQFLSARYFDWRLLSGSPLKELSWITLLLWLSWMAAMRYDPPARALATRSLRWLR